MALKSGLLGAWSHFNGLVAGAVYGAGNAFLQSEKKNLPGLVADVARCSLAGAFKGLVDGQRHIDRLLACNQKNMESEAAEGPEPSLFQDNHVKQTEVLKPLPGPSPRPLKPPRLTLNFSAAYFPAIAADARTSTLTFSRQFASGAVESVRFELVSVSFFNRPLGIRDVSVTVASKKETNLCKLAFTKTELDVSVRGVMRTFSVAKPEASEDSSTLMRVPGVSYRVPESGHQALLTRLRGALRQAAWYSVSPSAYQGSDPEAEGGRNKEDRHAVEDDSSEDSLLKQWGDTWWGESIGERETKEERPL